MHWWLHLGKANRALQLIPGWRHDFNDDNDDENDIGDSAFSENDTGDSDVDATKDLRSAGQSLASSFPLVGDFTLSMNSSACLKRSAASLYQIHVRKSYLGHRLFSSSTPVIIVFFSEKKRTNRSARVLSLV